MKNFRNSILLITAVFSVVALALVIGTNVHGTGPVHSQSLAWGPLSPPDDDNFIAWGPLPPPEDGNFIAWGPLPPPEDGNFIAWGPLPPPDDDFLSA